jgi:hypothetical protein
MLSLQAKAEHKLQESLGPISNRVKLILFASICSCWTYVIFQIVEPDRRGSDPDFSKDPTTLCFFLN